MTWSMQKPSIQRACRAPSFRPSTIHLQNSLDLINARFQGVLRWPYLMIFSADWRRFLRVDREGWIRLTPEDSDDIWALYNIIGPGDEVEAFTMRRVLQENASGTVVDSQKVKVLLAVVAEKIDVDIKGASLRVNGKNVRENRHVKVET